MHGRRRSLLAGVLALSLGAAACSSSTDGAGADTTVAGSSTAIAPTTSVTTTAPPTTVATTTAAPATTSTTTAAATTTTGPATSVPATSVPATTAGPGPTTTVDNTGAGSTDAGPVVTGKDVSGSLTFTAGSRTFTDQVVLCQRLADGTLVFSGDGPALSVDVTVDKAGNARVVVYGDYEWEGTGPLTGGPAGAISIAGKGGPSGRFDPVTTDDPFTLAGTVLGCPA